MRSSFLLEKRIELFATAFSLMRLRGEASIVLFTQFVFLDKEVMCNHLVAEYALLLHFVDNRIVASANVDCAGAAERPALAPVGVAHVESLVFVDCHWRRDALAELRLAKSIPKGFLDERLRCPAQGAQDGTLKNTGKIVVVELDVCVKRKPKTLSKILLADSTFFVVIRRHAVFRQFLRLWKALGDT